MHNEEDLLAGKHRATFEELLGYGPAQTKKESARYGKSLRKAVPRDVFAAWQPHASRPSATDLIRSQDAERIRELIPVRHERMAASAFTFFRGTALVMAEDLSTLPTTGIEVQLCGDAHISNFGLFLSPERRTMFDINDFDETTRGPWEWDVARLATSVEICGRYRLFSYKQIRRAVLAAVSTYREAMRAFAQMGNLETWYAHIDVDTIVDSGSRQASKNDRKKIKKRVDKAKKKNSAQAANKLTEVVDGSLRIVDDPPFVIPLRNLVDEAEAQVPAHLDMARVVSAVLARYRKTLAPERAALVASYRGMDIARKVVGVGSVGTRAWIVVLQGADENDSLVLQVKEAKASVLEHYVGKAPQANHGQRVVEGQRAIQTASDSLLGWTTLPDKDGRLRDYYVRQLWDGKGSFDLDAIGPKQLCKLAGACGWTLAHAHARTGNRFAIAAYLGKSDVFDEAMASFASSYARQNERDYAEFIARLAGR